MKRPFSNPSKLICVPIGFAHKNDDEFELADLESAIAGTMDDDDDDLDDFELEDF